MAKFRYQCTAQIEAPAGRPTTLKDQMVEMAIRNSTSRRLWDETYFTTSTALVRGVADEMDKLYANLHPLQKAALKIKED